MGDSAKGGDSGVALPELEAEHPAEPSTTRLIATIRHGTSCVFIGPERGDGASLFRRPVSLESRNACWARWQAPSRVHVLAGLPVHRIPTRTAGRHAHLRGAPPELSIPIDEISQASCSWPPGQASQVPGRRRDVHADAVAGGWALRWAAYWESATDDHQEERRRDRPRDVAKRGAVFGHPHGLPELDHQGDGVPGPDPKPKNDLGARGAATTRVPGEPPAAHLEPQLTENEPHQRLRDAPRPFAAQALPSTVSALSRPLRGTGATAGRNRAFVGSILRAISF